MTPLLRPVWCAASAGSFSSTTSGRPGARASSASAVASPTMPPPMMTASTCAHPETSATS